jgi:acyl-[acyl-carrier-protein]-phospholipid O-acyltransferase / long-chain-fatty-acid--[acyl-carrier-protein] ligase
MQVSSGLAPIDMLESDGLPMNNGSCMTLGQRLRAIAQTTPDREAIADSSGCVLTYGHVLQRAEHLAHWLTTERAGEPNIGVYLPSSTVAAVANYAITLAGKVAVNLNFTAGQQHCRAAVKVCELQTIFTSRTFLAKLSVEPMAEMVFVEDVRTEGSRVTSIDDSGPDSTACILFSSGTTGVPKGIQLTHWNILANAQGLAARIPPSTSDCLLGVLPFFHSFGYTFALWFPVLYGVRAVFHGNPTDARTIGELAEKYKATYLLSTPTLCQQYARKLQPYQFASLQYILVGAEKLRDSIASEFKDHFGIDLLAGYGCTELGPGVAINTPAESRPGSVGRPLDGIEVRIADPDTLEPRPAGQQGMILVNGPSRMPGYYRAPELTSQAIRDGFYVTGDLGYVDEDGFLYVTDRVSRFSKICGEMVPHLPIEEAICELTQSFVAGVPDNVRGERLTLLYTNPEATPSDIYRRLSQSGLPALWIPKREDIHPVSAIPVLPNGKVDLRLSRELAESLARRDELSELNAAS